jgi:chemotaxis protein CheZ
MSGPLATREPEAADYSAIEAAVMETERGRWFLTEYARRNRHAETESLLESLGRIERAVTQAREGGDIDRFRLDVLEMSRAIARTRAEIASIKPSDSDGRIVEASGELGSIVSATEKATSDILAAAERVQEVAWALREAGAATDECNELDQQAVGIYTACSFQDLTAQRTRKVIDILAFLEGRVNAMADIWQFAGEAAPAEAAPEPSVTEPPAIEPMSQDEVDFVLVEEQFRRADIEIELLQGGMPQEPMGPRAALYEGDLIAVPTQALLSREPEHETTDKPAAPELDDAFLFESQPAPLPADTRAQLQVIPGGAAASLAKARGGETLTPEEAAAALDALKSMSVEERTKLFS